MRITRKQVLVVIGFVVSGLLVFSAGCCLLNKRTACDSQSIYTDKQAEAVSSGKPAAEDPATEEPKEKTFTANQFCAACHYAFGDEKLAKTHEEAGIGCERCHGESERHRSDEDNVTPPEIMYTKDKIRPTCMMCHPRYKIEQVGPHKELLAGAQTIFDSDEDAPQITCTFCHAKQHRIKVRTIRWNKATGELLDE